MTIHETLRSQLDQRLFRIISDVGKELGVDVFIVGGWVRDLVLSRPSKDVDIVVAGDGIKLASAVNTRLRTGRTLKIFKNFGTAMLRYKGWDVEFVGARKESYSKDSRKPSVESGSLTDDLNRRDFTINTLVISLNEADYGSLIDQFHGLDDLEGRNIRTPLDPDITYSDDPLRMMRAVRFASQLGFSIDEESFQAIKRNAHRLKIVSVERIMDEFNKIMLTEKPGQGISLLHSAGLLKVFFPELDALAGVEVINGKAHKDNFFHTMRVLDKLSLNTKDLWLRWAALLHDIAKPPTKKFEPGIGWTFHGHEYLGHKMVESIFRRLKLPANEKMRYVKKLVLLHLRPIALTESIVTDSAVRRLLFDAGDDIDDLMLLCEADITSGNTARVRLYLKNFGIVRGKLKEIETKDRIRNWQPPVSGEDIMDYFNLKPCREVGLIKVAIREAILEGKIPNERKAALDMMVEEGKKIGLRLDKRSINP
jgi:poly(A) polymerase